MLNICEMYFCAKCACQCAYQCAPFFRCVEGYVGHLARCIFVKSFSYIPAIHVQSVHVSVRVFFLMRGGLYRAPCEVHFRQTFLVYTSYSRVCMCMCYISCQSWCTPSKCILVWKCAHFTTRIFAVLSFDMHAKKTRPLPLAALWPDPQHSRRWRAWDRCQTNQKNHGMKTSACSRSDISVLHKLVRGLQEKHTVIYSPSGLLA